MFYDKCIALFFVLAVTTTHVLPLRAAPIAATPTAANQSLTAQKRTFYPPADYSRWFDDPDLQDMNLAGAVFHENGTGDGLAGAGQVRDFLHNRPFSKQTVDIMQQAWAMPTIISFVDQFGLYDLSPLAAQKAIALAKQPIKTLTKDGVIHLVDAAHYYSKTGRQDYGDAIFQNLSSSLWPAGAPKDLSALIVYAHGRYLHEQGNEIEANRADKEYAAISLHPDAAPEYYTEKDWVACTTDWQPSYKAWSAINDKNYSLAKTLIAAMINEEKKKRDHTQSSIYRLIHLASQYNDKRDALELLEQLVDFTSSEQMLNVRLYLFAELFLLQDEETQEEHAAWAKLEITGKRIKDVSPPSGPSQTFDGDLPIEDYLVKIMDIMAIDYSINDQPSKALRILETALGYHPAASSTDYLAHLTLFETQVGNYTAAKKCLARCAPVYSSFVARAIETCCHAGKPAEGEEIANVLIDVQNKRLAALYGTPDPGNTEATSEQIKESRSDQLRFELSKVRFALGELQNKEGKFTDAEKTLKLIDDRANVNQLLRAQYIIALGQSLEGQQKYDEAIALYLTCKDATVNDGPVFERLTNTLAERPNLGQRERFETIEFLWRLGRYDRSTFTPASIQRLLDSAHTQNWDSSDLELMKEVRARALRVQGKSELGIDEKRFPTKDANTVNSVADCLLLADGEYLSGNCQNAVELTLQALTPENLPALQEHLESSAEERASFNVGGLINAGQFLGVETILKRCVTLISSHPQKWSKHAAVEKCALANFYLQTGRFHEAKNLTKEIVSTMNEDPDPFFSTGKQKSLAPYGTWYFPRRSIPKVYDLLELCGMYINARRPNDAKELAASVLNLQKKWLGAKNPDLIYTYEELARANRALNDHSQEKGCLLQTIALKAWNFTGKQILPDEDSKAYAALLSAEGKTAEARHLLTEKKIPDLYPDSYARNIFFYPIISRVRTYTINDEPHAIAVLKASIERNGAGNPETLEAISNLALLYWHAQRYDDAEKLLLQKLHILQDIEGRSGYRKATCLAELACLETSKHHYKRAKELLSRAEKSSAGPGAPEQLPEVLAGFAAVKFKLGEQEAARSLARVAVQKQYDSGIDLLMPDVFASSAKILAGTPLANKADEIAHTGTGRPIGKPWPQVYPGFFEIY